MYRGLQICQRPGFLSFIGRQIFFLHIYYNILSPDIQLKRERTAYGNLSLPHKIPGKSFLS
ncbi:hypothetical protein TPE_2724 [Treponema pedis str. T A4]|uniref:Uncharacterized protein n=1 Tax=Treponema pedis str. T A4 TaxID=1291379 RepID=S6A5A5_9SPIR|nr:hypothetical protein TPE_2724 [Treponema pedis str. T A4]